jgi:membrane-associated phospholipid phosphatase
LRERAVLSGAVLGLFLAGYFGVGFLASDPENARSLWTPLDGAIPFLLGSVFVYWSILPMALLPIFVVRDPAVFRRVALAYALAIALALAGFLLVPVTSVGLRPDAAMYADADFAGWLLQLLYFLDPPFNLFPSLHLALALLAALAAWRAHRPSGVAALAWTACIAASVCTTKQHYAVDVAAGLLLGALAHRACVAPLAAARADAESFTAVGLALFGVLVAAFYSGLYAAFLAGVDPWAWGIG